MINKDNPENLIIQSQEFSESELDKKEESSSKNFITITLNESQKNKTNAE